MKRNKLFLANGIIHLSGYLPLFYSLYSNKQESSEQIKESNSVVTRKEWTRNAISKQAKRKLEQWTKKKNLK